jgi:hypothetical protein
VGLLAVGLREAVELGVVAVGVGEAVELGVAAVAAEPKLSYVRQAGVLGVGMPMYR